MNDLPFDKPGTFYRGNLHTHSKKSDGALSPEAVCRFYREEGYDFLSITDHFLKTFGYPITDTRPYDTGDFITIAGAELHAGQTEFGDMWHILANGLPYDFAPPTDDETGPQLAQRALEAGAYVTCAHPAWYTLTPGDIASLGDIHAIEIYNGVSHDHNDRAISWHIFDIMAHRGHRYHALATDDAHLRSHQTDAGLGWVWVKAQALTTEGILTALKAGHFYASTGPRLHDVRVEGSTLHVRCSPAERIFVTGRLARARSKHGEGLREAAIPLESFTRKGDPYVRVTVRDAHGRQAWTNPIWLSA